MSDRSSFSERPSPPGQGRAHALRADRREVKTGSIVPDLDQDVRSGVRCGKDHRPAAGLPARVRAAGDSMPWSMLLRMRCMSGSPRRSMTVLSNSGLRALGDKRNLFSQLLGKVPHQALEPAERRSDRHHADAHCFITEISGQPLHLFGNGNELGNAPGERCQAEPRLDRYEFATRSTRCPI